MAKILIVERPNSNLEETYLWNDETKEIFSLDESDCEMLEEDGSIFKNDVAFTLEEDDES